MKRQPITSAAMEAVLAKLPQRCFAHMACNPIGARIVILEKGCTGYAPAPDVDDESVTEAQARAVVDSMNELLGVSPAQREAMLMGSLFGFDVPGADPDRPLAQAFARRRQARGPGCSS